MRVAIVGLGPSGLSYVRMAEGLGDVGILFDEIWLINGFSNVIWPTSVKGRGFAMDDVCVQALRAKGGNKEIHYLLEALKRHPGPIYTSTLLPKEKNPALEKVRDSLDTFKSEFTSKEPSKDEQGKINKLTGHLEYLEVQRELQESGGFPGMVAFPLEEVINGAGRDYFNSTIAYAIALAIHECAESIALYGADYTFPDRHLAEKGRACCEYWLGVASARGIKIGITGDSTMMDACEPKVLYGYDAVHVNRKIDEKGYCHIELKNKLAPTALEIEKRYHKGADWPKQGANA